MSENHDHQMELVISQLIKERGKDKTICPSEAARVMANLEGHPEGWRDWTEQARATAIQMAKRGDVIMLQRGKPINLDNVKVRCTPSSRPVTGVI